MQCPPQQHSKSDNGILLWALFFLFAGLLWSILEVVTLCSWGRQFQ
jgi:hypothetical protein